MRACADPKVILIATGSEVEIALDTADKLGASGIAARVVSLPNWRRFEAQDEAYREGVLPSADPERIPVEGGFAEVSDRGLTVLAERADVPA